MTVRSFAALRPGPRQPSPDEKLVRIAARKIFDTDEGKFLIAWMRATAESPLGSEASDGALRMKEGERQFVRKIEGLIAK